ncbi:MAG TPA: amidohydrolase family protein [Rhodanobacteraceae bacterium]|nr:amidohydrolase family protein [Rhodanobacteraceae bacterium]
MRGLKFALLAGAGFWSVSAQAQESAANAMAFVHVNVVPMDRERVLRDQTVIVESDKIVAIGPRLPPPPDAQVIDGHGTAYLSPGLADMHTHSETKNDLAVYLSQGVTTVLNMGGARASFVDKTVPAVNRGSIPGPHVYASFLVDGSPDYNGFIVKTPEQARAIVGLAKTNGYDFMKAYVGLAPDVFSALADEGHRLGLPVVGHGVTSVRLERQLAEGQVLVAHSEEFFYTFFTPPGVEESDTPPDESRIPEAVALAKKYGAAVTADLATYAAIARQIGRPDVVASFLSRPESAYLSPNDRLAWRNEGYVKKTAKLQAKLAFLRKMVKAMADDGVELVAGTDAPAVPGMLPGFSLHDDLDELEASGLTRYQVLATATRAPGTFIRRTKGGDPFGLVAAGYRADLVLSAADPLDALSTLRKPLGVMAHGHWYDAAALAALSERVRDGYRAAAAMP